MMGMMDAQSLSGSISCSEGAIPSGVRKPTKFDSPIGTSFCSSRIRCVSKSSLDIRKCLRVFVWNTFNASLIRSLHSVQCTRTWREIIGPNSVHDRTGGNLVSYAVGCLRYLCSKLPASCAYTKSFWRQHLHSSTPVHLSSRRYPGILQTGFTLDSLSAYAQRPGRASAPLHNIVRNNKSPLSEFHRSGNGLVLLFTDDTVHIRAMFSQRITAT